MDPNRRSSKQTFDAIVDTVRNAQPNRTDMEDAAARVWARLGEECRGQSQGRNSEFGGASLKLQNCEDYRALIPDYIEGRLSSARALLFKDHTHECVACRNALNSARGVTPPSRHVVRRVQRWRMAVLAAAAVLAAGFIMQQAGYLNFLLPVVKVNAMIRTIDGHLYRISGLNANSVMAGDRLKAGEPIRTAAGSRAIVELGDGTRIEM